MSPQNKMLKPIAAVVVLAVILLLVLNWWGDYRSPEPAEVGETTATADATATPEAGDSTQTAPGGEDAAAEAQGTVIVLVNGLNFRVQPEGSAELIRGLAQDTELVLLGEADGWYKVKDADGTVGYVSASEQYTRREP